MSIHLDPTQRRILGCLVEKQTTTPDVYPLTLNALVLAANQKNNRDPLTSYREHEIQGALRALMDREWVTELDRAGGRAARYAHRAGEQLAVDETDLALLAELWLRGPQSPQELATRASRMRPVPTADAAETRLRALAARPVPYVGFLGRRPGERVPRWGHLFGDDVPAAEPTAPTAPSPAAPSRPTSGSDAAGLAALADRVERLERAVAELRAAIGG